MPLLRWLRGACRRNMRRCRKHPGQHTDASIVRPPASESKRQRLLALAAGPVPAEGKTEPDAKGGPPSKDVVIDVIVAYTKAAAGHYADIQHELVDLAIEEANESFRMSNLSNIKLRLVHAYQTDYVEKGTHFNHVWRFADKGHGYVNGTKWRDIMSYKESCDGCSRLPVWSGPDVMVNGEPAGSVDLDNARVVREHAARVAGFR